ncbi:MAG: hypothetical protein ACKPEA_06525 [Planctomycetota bacterium]
MRPSLIAMLALALPMASLGGCNVAPKSEDRTIFVEEARDGLKYFEKHVTGLTRQIRESAGYAVFPGAGQWGIIFTGGSFGRGAVFTPDGTQIGWAAVNNFNLGLQAGGQGKKILLVFANVDVLNQFKQGLLTGKAEGLAVAGDKAATGIAPFQNGIAAYVGAEKGLMAGGMIGMENFRYRELGKENVDPE